jgi:hypothetical protein
MMRRKMMSGVDVRVIWADEEHTAEVDYTVTSWGCGMGGPNSYGPGDPPEPPEFEINSIEIEIEGGLALIEWEQLSETDQDKIEQAIYEACAEGPDDYYD